MLSNLPVFIGRYSIHLYYSLPLLKVFGELLTSRFDLGTHCPHSNTIFSASGVHKVSVPGSSRKSHTCSIGAFSVHLSSIGIQNWSSSLFKVFHGSVKWVKGTCLYLSVVSQIPFPRFFSDRSSIN